MTDHALSPRKPDARHFMQWISEVLHFCSNLPIILVGCKKDLRNDPRTIEELRKTSQRPVSTQEGQAVAQKIGARRYIECSARTGEGVRDVFQVATRESLSVRFPFVQLSSAGVELSRRNLATS